MKRIGAKKPGDVSPDLTSFSDIANLLIIFFILTTSLVRPFGRQMDMPSSAKPPEQQKSADTPTVRLAPDKILFSEGEKNERELTMDQLRAELWKRNFPSLKPDKRAVVVETTPDVKYERYYHVATAIAAAGGVIAIMEE